MEADARKFWSKFSDGHLLDDSTHNCFAHINDWILAFRR
ncbi:hypothetical protein M565_ctg1P0212 [Vibrio cyclitrophicus FF75]|nr:hypothetical protein M565_ctg1P0212 [Vibrio cyclitrophicus FF75]